MYWRAAQERCPQAENHDAVRVRLLKADWQLTRPPARSAEECLMKIVWGFDVSLRENVGRRGVLFSVGCRKSIPGSEVSRSIRYSAASVVQMAVHRQHLA